MGAEHHYLNAVEAYDEGNAEKAYEEAMKAVKIDPEHIDAWQICAETILPQKGEKPTLVQAAKSLAAVRKIIALDPNRTAMWMLGGRLLTDELGLLDEGLQWWQDLRHHLPEEVTPLVEQASLLADMGHYLEAKYRLDTIIEENLDGGPSQIAKIHQLRNQVIAAANLQPTEHFKPWEKHHNGWGAIEMKMGKGPVSESFLFLITTVPVLMVVVYFSNQLAGQGWGAFCLTSLIIFGTVLFGMRTSKRLFHNINRPAFNLLRAMNFEANTGYSVIHPDIRTSALYMYIMQRKPLAWQERMIIIIEEENPLPKNWKPEFPDFDSHLDEIGIIEDGDTDEFQPFEEE
ncbi:MAG: tetratricopeptide repeat protein [Candidatus Poseidoniales archaeon]|nr:hypothetical protein [Euryarchaeota archaeon]RJU93792.1 MAG: tetratricopeptide repeat protein [Candidatus Poseidoniales archaeon]